MQRRGSLNPEQQHRRQGQYRYAEPLLLPKGATITMIGPAITMNAGALIVT